VTRWQPYPEYKDSGVDWLRKIPAHWGTTRIKRLANPDCRSFTDGDWIELPYITDKGVRLIQTGNIGIGQYREQGYRYVSEDTFNRFDCTEVIPGDVLICRLAAPVGRACLAPDLGVRMITSVDVCILKPRNTYEPRYVVYFLSTGAYLNWIESLSRGSTRARISRSMLGDMEFIVPPLSEQRAIAAFLDHQTAKIDALIAEQRHLIELLQERRAALISHAVTKGLDPDAPMKNSGTSWIGSIPGHWRILQLRRVIRRFVDYRGRTPEKVDDGIPLITAGNIKNGSIHFGLSHQFIREEDYDNWMVRGLPEVGDVLITTEAPLGESAQVVDPRIALAQRIILLKAHKQRITSDYLKYHFAAKSGRGELWSRATGSTAIGIKAYHLKATLVTVPPIEEQKKITAHLDRETAKIDALITEIETNVAHIEEYRTALISAAVTGKIDVRDALPADAPAQPRLTGP
jgi:type I restriction enzyme S subunit